MKTATMNFFAKKETPKEMANRAKRETKKEVRGAQRDMEREVRELDRQEKQITMELKQRAKKVNSPTDPALNALAKQLVQVRQQRTKLQSTKAHIGAIGMHATVTASQIAAAAAIGSVTGTMKVANGAMDAKATAKIMSEFQRENEKMSMKTEMMDDALMDAFDTEGLDEEAEQITNQVLAELGVELDSKMVGLNVPSSKVNAQQQQLNKEEQDAIDDILPDLKARLNAL